MQLELKKAIATYIKEKDPGSDVVVNIDHSHDWKTGTVQYNWDHIGKLRDCGLWNDASDEGAEELVRAYLLVRLCKDLDYPLDKSIHVEESYSIGHSSHKKEARLDVRVGDRRASAREKSFMLIECKAPEKYEAQRTEAIRDQLFAIAPQEHLSKRRDVHYLAYYTVSWENEEIREEVALIDFEQYKSWDEWDEAGQPLASKIIPANYGIAIITIYVNKAPNQLQPGELLLDKSKDRDFFQRLQVDLHRKLWGGSTEYNYIFKNLARLLLAKIYDEQTTPDLSAIPSRYDYRFQVQQRFDPATKKTVKESPQELFERINQLVKDSADLLGYSEDDKQNYGIERAYVGPNKVAYVVNQLQSISVTENVHARTGDILGDFFERIISEGFKQDKGTFFTHKNIVYFVLYGLCLDDLVKKMATDPAHPSLPFICDPACGSGTFLIEGMKFVTKHLPPKNGQPTQVRRYLENWLKDMFPYDWARDYIYGIDDNADLALSAKVNMVLHRDGNVHIFKNNALNAFSMFSTPEDSSNLLSVYKQDIFDLYPYEVNERFDIIVSNPPFAVPLDPETKKEHRGRFLFADTRNSEILFLERYYQLLRPNGRMGIVLPESIFDTADNLPIRLFLYRHFEILAIISLPYLAFHPFTATKTCLLFARKKTRDELENFNVRWKEAAREYRKLRNYPLIAWTLKNKELRDSLMRLCVRLDCSYQTLHNLLHPDNISDTLADELRSAVHSSEVNEEEVQKRLQEIEDLFEQIDEHFANSPFDTIRLHARTLSNQSTKLLTAIKDFADSVGEVFELGEDGRLLPESLSTDVRKRIADAAKAADKAEGPRLNKQQKIWEQLCTRADRYFARSVNHGLNDDEARPVIVRFLKSLLDSRDRTLAMLDLMDKYLDDIAAVGEINDNFGMFPNQTKSQPFAHVNAWWAFDEVMGDEQFRYNVLLAEPEEIGYKKTRARKGGYEERDNYLFSFERRDRMYDTIQPDNETTLLGKLRAHVRNNLNQLEPHLSSGFLTSIENAVKQTFLRFDPKYIFFWDIKEGRTLPCGSNSQEVRLSDCLLPYVERFIPKGELGEERIILDLEDVEGRASLITSVTNSGERIVTEVGSQKLDFADCNMVFSRLEPYLGKIVLNNPEKHYIGTTEWIPLKLRKELVLPMFLKYILLMPGFLDQRRRGTFWLLRSGKRHARINERDFGHIIIPLPSIETQREIVLQLEKMEKDLEGQRRQLVKLRDRMDDEIYQSLGVEESSQN